MPNAFTTPPPGLAGLKKIDHYVTSHFHTDHFGSISQLVELIQISKFYDHALMQESQDYDKNLYAGYLKVAEGKRQVLRAGDTVPLKSGKTPLKVICVVSDGRGVVAPVGVGAGVNPFCQDASMKAEDKSDNARSIGLLVSYGNFEFLNLGDLSWNIEHQLVCPDNVLGRVDMYMVDAPRHEHKQQPRCWSKPSNPRSASCATALARLGLQRPLPS